MRKLTSSRLLEVRSTVIRGFLLALLATSVAFAGVSCLTDNVEVPELSGPSELGTSVEMRAIPDQLVADGFSSSVIEAVVRGPNSERRSGVEVLFDISQGGPFFDLGNIAPLNGPRPVAGGVESGPVSDVTDSNGVARARYWAPFRSDQENDTVVTINGRPAGTDFNTAIQRTATIFLRAANRPSFPGTASCSFIVEPQDIAYRVGEPVFFTATQVTGENGHPIARYEWDFGDRASRASGRNTGHVYTRAGDYTVTLFTTESVSGTQTQCEKIIVVTTSGAAPPPATTTTTALACTTPTADFTPSGICSSGDILADDTTVITFDGSVSSGGSAGETITTYTWSFGDGNTGTGQMDTNVYASTGVGTSVAVTLTVTNSCGAMDSTSQTFDLIAPPCP